ncbi:MAG: hypothetical protein RR918_03005, partial [Anaerovoracaceae bacterium]
KAGSSLAPKPLIARLMPFRLLPSDFLWLAWLLLPQHLIQPSAKMLKLARPLRPQRHLSPTKNLDTELAWPLRNPIGQNAEVGTSFATPTSHFANATSVFGEANSSFRHRQPQYFAPAISICKANADPRPLAMAN